MPQNEMNGLKRISVGRLQKVIGVLAYGMAGCAGQTHHLTLPNSIHVPHLFDSEQQMTTVNVSTYIWTRNGVLDCAQTGSGAYAVPSAIGAGGPFQMVKWLRREGVNYCHLLKRRECVELHLHFYNTCSWWDT
jgi:hypothetical protein